ncbi:MAG TPA: helix-turn-helix domain-containing protein [Candidatus Acidoferrales bacterium]|jgi:excisionase family DNA binding protein|nr:helix-turn-helix domain-containing protein [Candidatus Acidoferrales bacterium]
MTTINDTELLTPEELAAQLKVPVSWIYEHVRARACQRLPGFKLGKYWRFRERDVIEWLQQRAR